MRRRVPAARRLRAELPVPAKGLAGVEKRRWGTLRQGSQTGWALAGMLGLLRVTRPQAAARPRSARAQRRRRGSMRAPSARWRQTRTRLRRCCAPAAALPPAVMQVPAHTSLVCGVCWRMLQQQTCL